MSNGAVSEARTLSRSELRSRRDSAIRRTGLTVGGERIFRGSGGKLVTEREARREQALAGEGGSVVVDAVSGQVLDVPLESAREVASLQRESGGLVRVQRDSSGQVTGFSAPVGQAFQESVPAINLLDPSVRRLAEQGFSPREIVDLSLRSRPLDEVASGFARASVIGEGGERLQVVVDRQGNVVQVLSSERLPERVGVVSPGRSGFFDFSEQDVSSQPFFFSRVRDRALDAPPLASVSGLPSELSRIGVAAGAGFGELFERGGAAVAFGTPLAFLLPQDSGLRLRGERQAQDILFGAQRLAGVRRDDFSLIGSGLRSGELIPDVRTSAAIGLEALIPFAPARRVASAADDVSFTRLLLNQPRRDIALLRESAADAFNRLVSPVDTPPRFRTVVVRADPASGVPFAAGDLPSTIDFGAVAPRFRTAPREFLDAGLTPSELAELQASNPELFGVQTTLGVPRGQSGRALVTESGQVVGFSSLPSPSSFNQVDELFLLRQREADALAARLRSGVDEFGSDVVLFGDLSRQRELADFLPGVVDSRRLPSQSFAPVLGDAPSFSRLTAEQFTSSPFVDLDGLLRDRRLFDIPGVRGRRAELRSVFAPQRSFARPARSRLPSRLVDVDVRAPLRSVDDLLSGGVARSRVGRGLLSGVVSGSRLGSSVDSVLSARSLSDVSFGSSVVAVQDVGLLDDVLFGVRSRSGVRSREDSVLRSDSLLRQEQDTARRVRLVPRARSRLAPRDGTPRPRVRADIDLDLPSVDSLSPVPEWRVVVGRPGNVVYQELGVGGEELVSRAVEVARSSPAATVRAIPINDRAERVDVFAGLPDFRKSKSVKDAVVERNKARIDSPGELLGITRKGIEAVRRSGGVSRAPDAARELVDLGIPLRSVRRRANNGGGLLDDFF